MEIRKKRQCMITVDLLCPYFHLRLLAHAGYFFKSMDQQLQITQITQTVSYGQHLRYQWTNA